MYRYFVSYVFEGPADPSAIGYGWMDVTLERPISGGEDVKRLTDFVERKGSLTKVTIINFRRFEGD